MEWPSLSSWLSDEVVRRTQAAHVIRSSVLVACDEECWTARFADGVVNRSDEALALEDDGRRWRRPTSVRRHAMVRSPPDEGGAQDASAVIGNCARPKNRGWFLVHDLHREFLLIVVVDLRGASARRPAVGRCSEQLIEESCRRPERGVFLVRRLHSVGPESTQTTLKTAHF